MDKDKIEVYNKNDGTWRIDVPLGGQVHVLRVVEFLKLKRSLDTALEELFIKSTMSLYQELRSKK